MEGAVRRGVGRALQDGCVRVWDVRARKCIANVAAHAHGDGSGPRGPHAFSLGARPTRPWTPGHVRAAVFQARLQTFSTPQETRP